METNKADSKKIIAVIGPTASGKTSLAIEIAKKFNGELINTDSRQIYKFMDIGTAKGDVTELPNTQYPIPEKFQTSKPRIQNLDVYKLEGVPIHLINIVAPNEVLTLSQYQKLAYAAIGNIVSKGKLPILVGGTGLYIDAVLKGYKFLGVKPDQKLRKQLNSKTVKQLSIILNKLNSKAFERLNESDRANKHRLIRLIEVTKAGGEILHKKEKPDFDVLYLKPKRSREELYERINKRAKIIVDSGLIDEVKNLIKKGYKFTKPAMTAISYPIVKKYLDKEITNDELIEQFAQGDRNYARRQETWFRRYNSREVADTNECFKMVSEFLSLK